MYSRTKKKISEWTFRVTDTVQIMHANARLRNSIFDDFENPLSVMYSCIARKKAFTGGCDVGMPNVRQHGRGSVYFMPYDPCTELICRTFEPKREIWPVCNLTTPRIEPRDTGETQKAPHLAF